MDLLRNLPPGRVRLAICDDYPALRNWARAAALTEEPFIRLVEIPNAAGRKVDTAMSLAIEAVSKAALALWPDWTHVVEPTRSIDEAQESAEHSTEWERQAAQLCQAGKPPLFPRLNLSLQAQRLSRVLDERRLLFLVPLSPTTVTESDIAGFAGLLDWLAIETQARVLAIVGSQIADHPALDRLRYESLDWRNIRTAEDSSSAKESAGSSQLIFPVIGKPHPFSPGEQCLARALEDDAELGGLFRYNHPLVSAKGNRFIVDLYWPDGGLVVEVDSYRFHGDANAFASDRQRDFELLIGGCLVLRLTHDEIINDVGGAVGKIRELVRFHRSRGSDYRPHAATNEEQSQ